MRITRRLTSKCPRWRVTWGKTISKRKNRTHCTIGSPALHLSGQSAQSSSTTTGVVTSKISTPASWMPNIKFALPTGCWHRISSLGDLERSRTKTLKTVWMESWDKQPKEELRFSLFSLWSQPCSLTMTLKGQPKPYKNCTKISKLWGIPTWLSPSFGAITRNCVL